MRLIQVILCALGEMIIHMSSGDPEFGIAVDLPLCLIGAGLFMSAFYPTVYKLVNGMSGLYEESRKTP